MIALQEAYDVRRDANFRVFAWRVKRELATFESIRDFEDYVDKHVAELDPESVVAFSGSASTLEHCQEYLRQMLKGK